MEAATERLTPAGDLPRRTPLAGRQYPV